MPDGSSLKDTIWQQFCCGPVALATPKEGPWYPHGATVLNFVLSRRNLNLKPAHVGLKESLSIKRPSLIVIGCINELCPDVLQFLYDAQFPQRFDFTYTEYGCEIRDRHAVTGTVTDEPADGHYGFVFLARSNNFAWRPTMGILGNSALGVEAASLWVNQPCLSTIPPPPNYPEQPLEALIRLKIVQSTKLQPSHFDIVLLSCGNYEFNFNSRIWEVVLPVVPIQVIHRNGDPIAYLVGEDQVPVKLTGSVLSRLLQILVDATVLGKSITVMQIQKKLYPGVTADKSHVINARKSDLDALVPDGNLVIKKLLPDQTTALSLRARFIFVDAAARNSV